MKSILLALMLSCVIPSGTTTLSETTIMASPEKGLEKRDYSFEINKRYVIFPVVENNKKVRVAANVDGKYLDDFHVCLSTSNEPDYYVFIDLENYQGKTLNLNVSGVRDEQIVALDLIRMSDEIPSKEPMYQEKYRPLFHYTPQRGVMGDPNGLIYHDGLYHLYHQHNPYGIYLYNTGWGHATSPDLIHWTQHKEAIRSYKLGDDAWSGSAVVDFDNTSGLQKGNSPVIVAVHTSSGRGEVVHYSNDGGYTFSEYEGNPVLTGAVAHRDPKIFWYEPGQHWVMARHLSLEKKGWLGVYTSNDLKNWKLESKEGTWFHSCPELLELPIEGKKGETRWIAHDMFCHYKVGVFDGKKFTPDQDKQNKLNYGSAFVAGQAFNHQPDGKVIFMAFSYNGVNPDMPFQDCMLFPLEMRLRETADGLKICPKPIDNISLLHDKSIKGSNKKVDKFNQIIASKGDLGEALHMKLSLKNVRGKVELDFRSAHLTIDRDSLFCSGSLDAPVAPVQRTAIDENGVVKGPLKISEDGRLDLELILDKTTLEIFANDGELYMPIGRYFYPDFTAYITGNPANRCYWKAFMDESESSIVLKSDNPDLKVKSFELHTMKSIWK